MTFSITQGSISIMQGKALYFRLIGYTRLYWGVFVGAIIATIAMGLTEAALPTMIKPLLDGSFVDKDPDWINGAPLLIVALFTARAIATFASAALMNTVSSKIVMTLRQEMFAHIMRLPTQYFNDNATGITLSKITYNTEQVTAAASEVLVTLIRDSVTIIGLLAWILYLDWKLALIVLIIVPPTVILIQLVSKRLRRLSKGKQNMMGDLTQTLDETIGGQKIIHLYGGEQQEVKRFNHQTNWVRRFHMKEVITNTLNVQVIQLLAVIAFAFIVYIAAVQSAESNTSVGTFVSFFTAMAMLLSPLKKLTNINSQLQKGLAAAESIFALLDHCPEEDKGTKQVNQVSGHIQLSQVSLFYPDTDTPALSNIDIDIKPGETIALVGASGSGKSTLVNLLPRFYAPSKGNISIDGINITDLSLTNLRQHIALVSQEVVLFNDTIAANIAYGELSNATEHDIYQAALSAHALEFIEQLPDGLNTMLSENGSSLSGGQRQRLAIARALLKNAPILILDEATSALDTHSERKIQQALETLQKDRTTIVIAHRLSTIENADRILVLNKGQILEQGKHADLLALDGLYANLHRQQFKTA